MNIHTYIQTSMLDISGKHARYLRFKYWDWRLVESPWPVFFTLFSHKVFVAASLTVSAMDVKSKDNILIINARTRRMCMQEKVVHKQTMFP